MKTKIFSCLTILLIFLSSLQVMGQPPSFSGEWKLNREKSLLQDSQLFLSKITVKHKNDSLFTTRVYENTYGEEYPFDENISLDGKECKIVIYDMPRTSKASLSASDGSIAIESTTTFYGSNGEENLNARETWKIENGGKILSITFNNSFSGGTTTGTHYFDKVN